MGAIEGVDIDALSNKMQEADAPEIPSDSPSNISPQGDDVPDLPEKFKWDGKPWTREELQSHLLRHSDYTKKTQELAAQRKEWEKYTTNYRHDLEKVRLNPALAEEFKRIYPKEFHAFLEEMLPKTTAQSKDPIPKEFTDKLSYIESRFKAQEVKESEARIDAAFSKHEKNYPLADKAMVLAMAQQAVDQKLELNDKTWEDIFKKAHSRVENLAKKHYGTLVKQQKEANTVARDTTQGGGIPGDAPRAPKTFREATEMALQDAANNRGAFAR